MWDFIAYGSEWSSGCEDMRLCAAILSVNSFSLISCWNRIPSSSTSKSLELFALHNWVDDRLLYVGLDDDDEALLDIDIRFLMPLTTPCPLFSSSDDGSTAASSPGPCRYALIFERDFRLLLRSPVCDVTTVSSPKIELLLGEIGEDASGC